MKTLTAIVIISFLGIFIILIRIMRNAAKIKRQNDMIYEAKLREDRFMKECKRIAEEDSMYTKDYANNKVPLGGYDLHDPGNNISMDCSEI